MYIRRDYLQQLIAFKDTDFVKVITGVRRSGKSVLLQQYQEYLHSQDVAQDHILYLNLESFEYQRLKHAQDLADVIEPLIPSDGQGFYLLVDEVQFVDGWQRVINGLRVSFDCEIVVTESNAKLLSGELATLLSGRYVEIVVYPFSFKEFIVQKKLPMSGSFFVYRISCLTLRINGCLMKEMTN